VNSNSLAFLVTGNVIVSDLSLIATELLNVKSFFINIAVSLGQFLCCSCY
jgi:hypothetical protein